MAKYQGGGQLVFVDSPSKFVSIHKGQLQGGEFGKDDMDIYLNNCGDYGGDSTIADLARRGNEQKFEWRYQYRIHPYSEENA